MPQGLNGQDRLRPGDQAQSWSFTMPRLKGSPVKGSFTLIQGEAGWRGYIDFDGKARRMVNQINWLSTRQVQFSVDSWMGPFQPVVTLQQQALKGYIEVGNVRYPTSGQRLTQPPAGIAPVLPSPEQVQQNLLGGEAALWAENINSQIIDTKLWPRAFVVAERLWSAPNVTNTDSLYSRLAAMDSWSSISVGTLQHAQTEQQMMRLADGHDIAPLRVLAEVLEPAQYYTRQHLKYQAGHYDYHEPLNRLADVLPAESEAVRQLQQQVAVLIANRKNPAAASAVRAPLQRWQDNTIAVLPMINASATLKPLAHSVQQIEVLTAMGIALVNAYGRNQAFGASEVAKMQATLDAATEVQDETVIALVRPLETLLRAFQ